MKKPTKTGRQRKPVRKETLTFIDPMDGEEGVSFGQWFRLCRESLNLTQKQFAQKLDIGSYMTILHYEQNQRMPKARILPKISSLLQKEIERLTENDREGVLTACPHSLKVAQDACYKIEDIYKTRRSHSHAIPGPDIQDVLKKRLEYQLVFLVFLQGRNKNR